MTGPDTPARLGMLAQHDAGPDLVGCGDLRVGETDVGGVDFGVVGEFHRSNPRLLPPVAGLKGNIVGIHGLMFRGRVTRGIRGYQVKLILMIDEPSHTRSRHLECHVPRFMLIIDFKALYQAVALKSSRSEFGRYIGEAIGRHLLTNAHRRKTSWIDAAVCHDDCQSVDFVGA